MTEIATIDWFGRWETSVFSENTAVFYFRWEWFLLFILTLLYGPRQVNLVLIAYASSEGSGGPAHLQVSPEPPLLAYTSSESRGTFRQKARSLAFLNGWACAVKTCHDGMLEDTNSLDGAHMLLVCYLLIIIFLESDWLGEFGIFDS